MELKLLSYTSNPEQVVATAARTCYTVSNPAHTWGKMTDPDVRKKAIEIIKSSGHDSPLEHASFTFAVSGVSRALLAQITRHRIASFSVQSQRYVSYEGGVNSVVPSSITENAAEFVYNEAMANALNSYRDLIDLGVAPEDARFVLPEATCTNIVFTMNARELIHFFSLRCCNRAQWEIRSLAEQMYNEVYAIAPSIFAGAGPSCIALGHCPEGEKCCGKIQEQREKYNMVAKVAE